MTKPVLPLVVAALASALPLMAQNADTLNKPLSETELLRTIDSLGTGDPARRASQSGRDTRIADARRDSRSSGAPSDEKKPKEASGPTEITAQEASFDQKANQAVFAGDVIVKNPEFNITCDKLTAFLRNEKAAAAPAGVVKPAATPVPAKAAPKGPNTGGLEKVIAEGSVVITQEKLDSEGNVSRSVGRGRRATYEASTGDVILTGRPELQQGINACVATDDSTVITLNREGRMKVTGPSKTVIRDAPENPTASNGR